jgi:AraC-like DNA-binding protein/uncharacterized membrane protein YiaA
MNLNYTLSFLIAGAILILAFVFLTNPLQTNKKGNFYFGLFLLLWSTFWLDEALHSVALLNNIYFITGIGFIQFLTPLMFYLSIRFYTNPFYKLRKKDIGLFLLPIAYVIILFYGLLTENALIKKLPNILIIINALWCTVLAYMTVKKHQHNIESFVSNKEPIDLHWIKSIIYTSMVSLIIVGVYNAKFEAAPLNLYINLAFLVIVYMMAYFAVKQREIYPLHLNINEIVQTEENQEEQKTKLLNSKELEKLKAKLLHLMETEKPYLDSELNLIKLAEKMSVSPHQLSYAINNGFHENFFQFINKYKVKKAEELLRDPAYDNYTIVAIGFDSGFNSKTAFNTTFKKITSYTPTEYRKLRSNL